MSDFGITFCKVNALFLMMSQTDKNLNQIDTNNKKDRKADKKMPDILNSLADIQWDNLPLNIDLRNKLVSH